MKKLLDVLEEYEKAHCSKYPDIYAQVNYLEYEGGKISFFLKETDKLCGFPSYNDMIEEIWEPYIEDMNEIVPINVNEMWKYTNEIGSSFFVTFGFYGGDLKFRQINTGKLIKIKNEVIHNKNGWERITPEVKDFENDKVKEFNDLNFQVSIIEGITMSGDRKQRKEFLKSLMDNPDEIILKWRNK